MKIQLVIPMSGIGKRFKDAGYLLPKPLIKVRGKAIINHVVRMFKDIENIIFICNANHLENKKLNLEKILKDLHPKVKIISIEEHKKGPIYAVLKAEKFLDISMPTIVNYCDFNSIFDNHKLKKFLISEKPDGCIFTYTGFHPHMLNNTNYAYVKKSKNNVIDIQEKKSFTEEPMKEEVSSGTYFFKSALLMLEYFRKTIALDLNVNGEYYVSMAYKPMLQNGLKVKTFLIDYFMQWGTPGDLEEFNWYDEIFENIEFKKNNTDITNEGTLMMPMAGKGSRFASNGYKTPKPFIKVSGEEMYIKAIKDLPSQEKIVIITREEIIKNRKKAFEDKSKYLNAKIEILNDITEGQACTCLKVMERNDIDLEKPLIISACDMGIIYDHQKYQTLLQNKNIDILVWGCKGYPGAKINPNMFSWIYEDKQLISNISVKENLNNPKEDHLLIGTFTFKKALNFINASKLSIKNNERINGEYYVDNVINRCIKMGLKVALFEIDYFICWGTPDELATFNYWENCFDVWEEHKFKKIV